MQHVLLRSLAAVLSVALALSSGCGDNIGSVFDPDGINNPPDSPAGDGNGIEAVGVGARTVEGRPQVLAAFPSGSGWAPSVPAVVVFNESVSVDSVSPPMGSSATPTISVRLQGTDQDLPASFDFLLGGTVVIVRPLTPLLGDSGQVYEVVVSPELTDVDAVPFGGTEAQVVATFSPDADTAADPDGAIVTTLPLDNGSDATLEDDIFLVFDRPADATSLTAATFQLRLQGGAPVAAGAPTFPIGASLIPGAPPETRVAQLRPTAPLAASTEHEVVVTSGITFDSGSGVLDFNNATPFSTFETGPVARPLSVTVGNATTGFPDKLNRANLETARIAVEVGASAAAQDVVVARIYASDPETMDTSDQSFVEGFFELAVAGAQTIEVDFTGQLGTVMEPLFEDGDALFAADLRRGDFSTGFAVSDADNEPALDVTLPTVASLGPPGQAEAVGDLVTDLETLSVQGVASERLGAASLVVGMTTVELFGSADDGAFTLTPVTVGLMGQATTSYSLTITDAAGNMSPDVTMGNVVQRGVTALPLGANLTVEVYDEVTLEPLQGADVVIETVNSVTTPVQRQTGADGRAMAPAADTAHTITVLRAGYDVFTALATPAGFVSLPLRPQVATASLTVVTGFDVMPGQTALVGSNLFSDPTVEAVQSAVGAPTMPPSVSIRAGRAGFVGAVGGTFEPTAIPAFLVQGCNLCGLGGATASAALSPSGTGVPVGVALLLDPAVGLQSLAATYTRDLSSAGFGTLTGDPVVRVMAALDGFVGTSLVGVGFSTLQAGTNYTINGSYALNQLTLLSSFAPEVWVSVSATDTSGAIVRSRRKLDNTSIGSLISDMADPAVPGVPTVSNTGSPFTGAPTVTFEDRQSPPVGFVGATELVLTDGAGRVWRAIREEDAATGSVAVALPDLGALGLTGLAAGTWLVFAEQVLFESAVGASAGDFLLEERLRTQASFARSAPVDFVVQ